MVHSFLSKEWEHIWAGFSIWFTYQVTTELFRSETILGNISLQTAMIPPACKSQQNINNRPVFFIVAGLTRAVLIHSFHQLGKKLPVLFHTQFNPGKEISFLPGQKLWNDWCGVGVCHAHAVDTTLTGFVARRLQSATGLSLGQIYFLKPHRRSHCQPFGTLTYYLGLLGALPCPGLSSLAH